MTADSLVGSIGELAKGTQRLAGQAVEAYAPVVDSILRSQCRDTHHIEQTLDGLLGFCFDPNALLLYKRLCRYYYDLDPSAAFPYVYAYRDMWDSDKDDRP
jgi:hypothetical protein